MVKEYPNEYCDALNKKTAIEGLYKGAYEMVVCTENPCLQGAINRIVDSNAEKCYTCPSPTGLIEEITTEKPTDNKTFLWVE